MFGELARGLSISLGEDFRGLLVAILPPGAFIGLGLLIAIKNLIDDRLKKTEARKRADRARTLSDTWSIRRAAERYAAVYDAVRVDDA